MAKIPEYAKQHINQAVGTLGIDPNAGATEDLITKGFAAVQETVQRTKQIADAATAAKLNRQATIAYEEKATELRNTHANDPEKLTQETQKAGEEIYGEFAKQISSPSIRSAFEAQSNTDISNTTISSMRWVAKNQATRARNDFTEARANTILGLGSAPDADTFNTLALAYREDNKETYALVYGESGREKLNKDLADGAERFAHKLVSEDPFAAQKQIDEGKLDKYLSADQIEEVKNLNTKSIENFEKNREVEAKAFVIATNGSLGTKYRNGNLTVGDLDNAIAVYGRDPKVSKETIAGIKTWRDDLITNNPAAPATQALKYHEYSKDLDILMVALSKDPDANMGALIKFQDKILSDFNAKLISKADFNALYSDVFEQTYSAAEELNAKTGERWGDGKAKTVLTNYVTAYSNFDTFMEEPATKVRMADMPRDARDRIAYDMRINYHILINSRLKRKGKALDAKDYQDAQDMVLEQTKQDIDNTIYGVL